MEKISKFNYEAFYLDYLEGNLSEEDTALLLDFLEKHPELKLEDDLLPEFNQETASLDPSFKAGLKQIELADEIITFDNAEQFIIAETEGLLDNSKIQELERIISRDGSLQKLRAQYAATRLKPDLMITFPEKGKLKRGRQIVLWPYVALAAAACVTAFFFLINGPANNLLNNNGTLAQSKDTITTNDSVRSGNKPSSGNGAVRAQKIPGEVNENPSTLAGNPPSVSGINPSEGFQVRRNDEKIDRLSRNAATELAVVNSEDMEVVERVFPVSQKTRTLPTVEQQYLGFEDMKNPIKPVTNRLGDLIDKEVDFRTAKATSKRPGGFLLKVGNFEISHKGN